MADVLIPDYLLVILIFFSLFAGFYVIGSISGRKEEEYEDSSDDIVPLNYLNRNNTVSLIFGFLFLAAMLYYISGLLQIYEIIDALPTGDEKDRALPLFLSLFGMGMSFLVLGVNFCKEIMNEVKSKVRYNRVMKKLIKIERRLGSRNDEKVR